MMHGMSCKTMASQRRRQIKEANGARNECVYKLLDICRPVLTFLMMQKAKLAKIKTKRERQKEMKVQAKANQKAKAVEANAAAAPSSDSPDKLQPARKKRKLDGGNSKRNQRQPLPSISRGHKDKGSRNKVSAEGHQRGKMTRKRDKFKMNADWKQSHCGGDSVLKIID